MCYVYLIQSKSGNVKIGYSDDPHKRLNTLKTGSAEKLVLRVIIKCKDLSTAQQLETFLHHHYAQYHISGEWFAVDISNIVFDLEFAMGLSSSILDTTQFDTAFEEDKPETSTDEKPPKLKRRNTREIVYAHFEKNRKDIDRDASELAILLNVRSSIVKDVQEEFHYLRRLARSTNRYSYRTQSKKGDF